MKRIINTPNEAVAIRCEGECVAQMVDIGERMPDHRLVVPYAFGHDARTHWIHGFLRGSRAYLMDVSGVRRV